MEKTKKIYRELSTIFRNNRIFRDPDGTATPACPLPITSWKSHAPQGLEWKNQKNYRKLSTMFRNNRIFRDPDGIATPARFICSFRSGQS
jgi:hypothetical protein